MTAVVFRCLWQRRPAGGFTPPAPPVGYLCQNEYGMPCGAMGRTALREWSGLRLRLGVRDAALRGEEVVVR